MQVQGVICIQAHGFLHYGFGYTPQVFCTVQRVALQVLGDVVFIDLDDGIDYYSFKNGIYQVFLQSDEVAEKIFYTIDFNFSGYWEFNSSITQTS